MSAWDSGQNIPDMYGLMMYSSVFYMLSLNCTVQHYYRISCAAQDCLTLPKQHCMDNWCSVDC